MRVISAYLLATLGGKSSPTSDDVKEILSSVGIEAPADRLESFFKELEGKDISEVIASGLSKLASVPSGGAVAAAPAAAAAGGGGAGAVAEKKEEKKEESEEEEDEDMGFSLFD